MPGSPTDDDDGEIGEQVEVGEQVEIEVDEIEGVSPVAISLDDYLWFVDSALNEMCAVVQELGDELVNRRPPFRDGNSAYAILAHWLGLLEYWGGNAVAGRPVQRVRAAEFTASGDVAGLLRRTEQARRRLQEDMVGLSAAAPPVSVRRDPRHPVPYTETKGAVLVHVLGELFEHLGQMEITRDALVASRRR
jgi:hypothetical protein